MVLVRLSNSEFISEPTENTTRYAGKCRSELCRNCVRSPRKHPQTQTLTGSHQEAFCGGKSLTRLSEEAFQYRSVSVAGFVFQACSFNHSDISPFRINDLRAVSERLSHAVGECMPLRHHP